MRIAIVTFDGFNELDSFIAFGLLNRLSAQGWKAEIASPSTNVTSMNGVRIQAQQPLEFANEADIVLFGSGIYTRAIAESFGKQGSQLDRCSSIGASDDRRAMLGRAPDGPPRPARRPACGDRPDDTALAHGGGRARRGLAVPRPRLDRHRRRLHGVAVPGGVGDGARRRLGGGRAGAALRCAGGREGRYVKRVLDTIRPFVGDAAA